MVLIVLKYYLSSVGCKTNVLQTSCKLGVSMGIECGISTSLLKTSNGKHQNETSNTKEKQKQNNANSS